MENSNTLELYEDLDIIQLVSKLDQEFGFENVGKLKDWFGKRHFNVSEVKITLNSKFENKIVGVKYIDGLCKIWQPKWSRQCRGVYLYKSISNKIYCLKILLQRGAEILTNIHLKTGIVETQDINEKKYDFLDKIQQENIEIFKNSGEIDGYLSFKNDGSLLGVTLITKECPIYSEIAELIDNHAEIFTKKIKEISERMKLPFLPFLSSSGTLFLSSMQGYTLTAIGCGMNIISYQELRKLASTNKPEELVDLIMPRFLESLDKFYCLLSAENQKNIMSLSFETICENRITCWDEFHTELAISYPKSMIRFLGCTFNHLENQGIYKPHFTLEENIKSAGWEQPLYWKISKSTEVEKMINDLNLVMQGSIKESDFYNNFPPHNSFPSVNNYIDYEGFVFYRVLSDGTYDYSKIKTNSYYVAHKLREEYMGELLKFSEFAETIFPLAKVVKNFHLKFIDKLKSIYRILNIDIKESEKSYFEDLPSEAKKTFPNYQDSVKAKIIVNNTKIWTEKALSIFNGEFDLHPTPELISSVKKLSMKIAFWEKNYEKNIEVIRSTEKRLCMEILYYLISSKNIYS